MSDGKKIRGENHDEKLDNLFKTTTKDEWIPQEGFEKRVLNRLRNEKRPSGDFEILAWKILPFAAAASIAILLVASMGDSIESLIYTSISDPLSIEGLLTILQSQG